MGEIFCPMPNSGRRFAFVCGCAESRGCVGRHTVSIQRWKAATTLLEVNRVELGNRRRASRYNTVTDRSERWVGGFPFHDTRGLLCECDEVTVSICDTFRRIIVWRLYWPLFHNSVWLLRECCVAAVLLWNPRWPNVARRANYVQQKLVQHDNWRAFNSTSF